MSEQKSSTKLCRYCKKEVDFSAKRCSHCHGDLRKWLVRHPILTVFGGLIGFVIFLMILGSGEDTASSIQNTISGSTPNDIQEESVIRISAKQLSEEYDANEVLADSNYKNHIVEINGFVDSIGKDILDTPYVTLEGRNTFSVVQCMFRKQDEAALSNLKKDQTIILHGRVSGKLLTNVLIKDCSIVQ
jgi:hypothetical protein